MKIFIKQFVFLIFVAFLIGCDGFPDDIPHKSDSSMIENFHNNKAEFEKLLLMIQEDEKKVGDRVFRIDKDWFKPKNLDELGISDERIGEYRKVFKQLDIRRGFYAYGKGDFYSFMSSAQGLAVSGSSKGYAWSKEPPKSLTESDLDEYHSQQNANDYIFRHIEGNWYLERDR
ncbi:MAG: hypothetical protein AAB336_03930 [Acidobacteriota bacterium]